MLVTDDQVRDLDLVDLIIGTVIFFISISTVFSYIKYLKKDKGGKA